MLEKKKISNQTLYIGIWNLDKQVSNTLEQTEKKFNPGSH